MSDAPERIWINKTHGQHPEDWDFTEGKHLTKAQLRAKIEYIRADRIEALTKERDDYAFKLADANNTYSEMHVELEALTEQLEAARADAKEAEAYAEELEREIELNEQEACMLEDDFIKADKEIDDLKAKLAKAVEALRFYAWENEMRLPSDGPWGAGSTDFGKVARTTLAVIKGGNDAKSDL